mmetsp:Transcript_6882/g.10970  ORF Transcript_6882/g.10970 Transcript_6882/m.10970 type:complete len:295 (+) Transcript_6882:1985-2869(+)
MDQFNILRRSIAATLTAAGMQFTDSVKSNLNNAVARIKDLKFVCEDDPIDGTGTTVISKLSAIQYLYVQLNAVTAVCSPQMIWAVYAALILVLITRVAPLVDLILLYVGELAYILLAITLSLKDVLLLIATASLTFKLFVDRPDQPILNCAPVSVAKGSAPGTRSTCEYCRKLGHTFDSCFARKADLLSQLASIERELERKAAAKASRKPVTLDTSSQGDSSSVSNRRVRRALRKSASASPQPESAGSTVNAPRVKGPVNGGYVPNATGPVYLDTGAFFERPTRVWHPQANYWC